MRLEVFVTLHPTLIFDTESRWHSQHRSSLRFPARGRAIHHCPRLCAISSRHLADRVRPKGQDGALGRRPLGEITEAFAGISQGSERLRHGVRPQPLPHRSDDGRADARLESKQRAVLLRGCALPQRYQARRKSRSPALGEFHLGLQGLVSRRPPRAAQGRRHLVAAAARRRFRNRHAGDGHLRRRDAHGPAPAHGRRPRAGAVLRQEGPGHGHAGRAPAPGRRAEVPHATPRGVGVRRRPRPGLRRPEHRAPPAGPLPERLQRRDRDPPLPCVVRPGGRGDRPARPPSASRPRDRRRHHDLPGGPVLPHPPRGRRVGAGPVPPVPGPSGGGEGDPDPAVFGRRRGPRSAGRAPEQVPRPVRRDLVVRGEPGRRRRRRRVRPVRRGRGWSGGGRRGRRRRSRRARGIRAGPGRPPSSSRDARGEG
mmetsp:Transcript_21068/g.49460  ORF Transcript_21068/g.49460 Transcript_21068/m.49460 type:complete len:425 (+) Transcript_21068:225-1499(+)